MSKVLVCWEDRYADGLAVCLRRCLRSINSFGIELFFDRARGLGGFEPFVKNDWPKAVSKGLPKSNGPMDWLICVADADRASDCCAEVQAPPKAPDPTQPWIEQAEQLWTAKLKQSAPIQAERVFGAFLRWNQESLLIAAHDMESVVPKLGLRTPAQQEKARAHLRDCSPSPFETEDSRFCDVYRKPGKCLEGMVKAAGLMPLSKNDPLRDDVLKDASTGQTLPVLQARVPDLKRLAERIQMLAP